MARNNFNARMLELIEEEEDDDYGILLAMAAVEGEQLAIESCGPHCGGSVPGHSVIDCDRAEGCMGLSSIQKITATIRMLAYGASIDSVDHYV
ncbi:hypothetical protein Q3G72_014895 [Acer saccharum]|nr:hypothetical protein Q3G72_014895 [Acer saccharum]